MVDKKQIMRLAGEYFAMLGDVSIDTAGMISCTGEAWTYGLFAKMPVKFKSVGGSFRISGNFLLTSLDGVPSRVDGAFNCTGAVNLPSLKGAPATVGGDFNCSGNDNLVSLVGAPEVVLGDFDCRTLPKLKSLDGLPAKIGGKLKVTYYRKLPLLRSLVAHGGVELTKILSSGYPFYTSDAAKQVEQILNKYAGQGEAGAFECGAELAEAGFKANARW